MFLKLLIRFPFSTLGKMVANLNAKETNYDEVVAYITGAKTQEGAN